MSIGSHRWIGLVGTALCALHGAWANAAVVRMEKLDGGEYVFRLAPVPAGAAAPAELMRVFVDNGVAPADDLPPLLGSYQVDGDVLTFTPRFPLQSGARYRAVLAAGAESDQAEWVFAVPEAADIAATVVEQIYPTTDLLPENQLKFYLHFSAAMSRGEAYQRVHLLDEAGERISLPFLELDQELWDPAGRRLTIFFDPARMKRGLLPHEEVGVPIEDGKTYTLVIEKEWLDARRKPLAASFEKRFRVGPADREPPRVEDWVVTAPVAGGRGDVTVEFPEPLDHALLGRLVRVTTAARRESVSGEIVIDQQETRWRFTPHEAWRAGRYYVEVGTVLEDLAGNTLKRLFEVDVFERVEERIARETDTIGFVVE